MGEGSLDGMGLRSGREEEDNPPQVGEEGIGNREPDHRNTPVEGFDRGTHNLRGEGYRHEEALGVHSRLRGEGTGVDRESEIVLAPGQQQARQAESRVPN